MPVPLRLFNHTFLAMPDSSVFIDRDQVVMKLIKYRCQLADVQSENDQKNEFVSCSDLQKTKVHRRNGLYSLFPSRKYWCHIGTKGRAMLDTVSRNELRLKYTYLKAKKNKCQDEWYLRLCRKADAIVNMALSQESCISPPGVSVIEKKPDKENKKIEYRPVCSFPLNQKIVFSLLNKFLTKLFDEYFYDCSYAFRVPNRNSHILQHLNAVEKVRNYRIAHGDKHLFVAECDMQKFYDTISHRIIKERFSLLLHWAKRQGRIENAEAKLVKRWFFIYVDCFNFVRDVLPHNKNDISHPFWGGKKCPEGYGRIIKWVSKKAINYKLALKTEPVGVPQGGALSGLIANIVMHFVDKTVLDEIAGRDVLYCRFCDDMILVGNDCETVGRVFNRYFCAVKKSRLVPHPHKDMVIKRMKDFWKGKTRGPYEWGEHGRDIFPWITFVGFDINWKGNLRIRHSSFQRHIAKQNRVVNELLLPYDRGGKTPRYCAATIINSLKSRLLAMSIGRVSLVNYKNNPNIRSWMSAFSILDRNHWSVRQLKELDRHRMIVIARAKKRLKLIECGNQVKASSYEDCSDSFFTYKGCPYSYYGQCFDYKEDSKHLKKE